MGGIELHPAIERLAVKGPNMTFEEAAIVNTMRRALMDSESAASSINRWLRELNPLGMKGPELSEWATEIADYVLPTHMRRQRATTQRK